VNSTTSTSVPPSEDYNTLVRQFKALQRILESKQNQLIVLTKVNADLTRQLLEVNSDVLASERQANQDLTNRVLFLETAYEELSKGCSKALQSK
jgi:GTPase involved in cell partitioning and DNA repair